MLRHIIVALIFSTFSFVTAGGDDRAVAGSSFDTMAITHSGGTPNTTPIVAEVGEPFSVEVLVTAPGGAYDGVIWHLAWQDSLFDVSNKLVAFPDACVGPLVVPPPLFGVFDESWYDCAQTSSPIFFFGAVASATFVCLTPNTTGLIVLASTTDSPGFGTSVVDEGTRRSTSLVQQVPYASPPPATVAAVTVACGYTPDIALSTNAAPTSLFTQRGVTASVTHGGFPVSGVPVSFEVYGANVTSGTANTSGGVATFTYAGAHAGIDSIKATVTIDGDMAADSTNATWASVPHTGVLAPVAGNGTASFCGDTLDAATESCLSSPSDVIVDASGTTYIADPGNQRIRSITPAGIIATFAGKTPHVGCAGEGGPATDACFISPDHLAHRSASIIVSDGGDHRVRLIDPLGVITTLAGVAGAPGSCANDAPATGACLDTPAGIDIHDDPSNPGTYFVYIAQATRVLRITVPPSLSTTVRDVVAEGGSDVSIGDDGSLFVVQPSLGRVIRVSPGADGVVDGNDAGEAVSTAVSDLSAPEGVFVDDEGHLLIADAGSHQLLVADASSANAPASAIVGGGAPTPGFCGNDGFSLSGCLDTPVSLFFDEPSETLYFAEPGNERVRKIATDQDNDGIADVVEDADKDGYQPEDVGIETDEQRADTDGDGCADSEELLANPALGGDRNPREANDEFLDGGWDFFDVPVPVPRPVNDAGVRNNVVTLADVIAIVFFTGSVNDAGQNANGVDYDQDLNGNGIEDGREYDRSPSTTPGKPWRSGAPNDSVTLQDALVALAQTGHTCSPAP